MAKKKKTTQASWASKDDLMNKVKNRQETAYANGWADKPSQPAVTGSTSTDSSGNVTTRKTTTAKTTSKSSSSWASADDLKAKTKQVYGNKSTAKVIGSTGTTNGQYWTKSTANKQNKLTTNQNLAREWVNAQRNSNSSGTTTSKTAGKSELQNKWLDKDVSAGTWIGMANKAIAGAAISLGDKLFGTKDGGDTVGAYGSREEYETDALKAKTVSPSIYESYVKQGQELVGNSKKKAEKYLAGQSNLAGASDISRGTEQDYYRGEGIETASPDIELHEMTDDEVNNYYYILKRYGETDANKYKNYVLNDTNAKIAQKAYQYNQVNRKDNALGAAGKALDVLGNVGTQFEAGVIAAGSALPNMKAFMGGTDDVSATPVSSYYASEMMQNTENPVEKTAYELAQNTGYMAPAIATGAVTGNQVVQDALLGLQTASNSYADSIREGKNQKDAKLYALMSGADETATNALLDGAGLVGGGVLTKALKNSGVQKAARQAIEKIGSPVLKKALTSAAEIGTDMGGEATQEFLQNFTDKLYRRIAFGEGAGEVNWKDPNTYIEALKDPEAWHDALIGALNAGLMQSGRIASGAANTLSENADRKKTFQNPEIYSQIAEGADTSTEEGQKLQELAQAAAEQTERGENVSAMQQDEIYQALNNAVQTAAEQEENAADEQKTIPDEEQSTAEEEAASEEYAAEMQRNEPENAAETQQEAADDTEATQNVVPYAVMANKEEAERAQLKQLSDDEISRRISENNRQFLESYTKNYDPEGQKAVLRNYTDGRDLISYMSSASEVYNMARHGARQDQLGARRILLSDAETDDIWRAGWRDREASIERVLNTSYKERQEKRTGGLMSAVPETSDSMKKVLDVLGKKTGIAFVVTNSGRYRELGSFDAESGVVTVDLQSDNPLGTVSHEMTHWIKAYNPAGYQLFEDAAMQSLARSEHFSLDAEMDKYKRAYPDLSNDGIREEIVANSTETFLNDEQFIKDICSGKNKGIGQRIIEWLTDVIDAFKEMISDRSFSRVADVLRQDVKSYERTRQLWLDGIDEAADNMETQQYAGEAEVKNQAMLNRKAVSQENSETESNGPEEIRIDGKRYQRKIKDELDGSAEVEQSKTLIAVHNLTADKLMKILEYDGIPMPSIAVTKAEYGWNKFGNISLVFRKDTIDPKANRKNKVYSADAWTATFPQIDFEVDENVYDRVAQRVREDMAGKVPDYLIEKAHLFNRANAGDAERQGLDGVIDAAKNDEGMKAAFLASQGEKIEDRTREVTTTSASESDQKKYRTFFGNLTPETRQAVIHMYSEGASLKEIRNTYGGEIIDAWCDAEAQNGMPREMAEKRKEGYRKNGLRLHRLLSEVGDAVKFQENGVQYKTETVRDETGIRREINSRVDEKAYEKWIRKLYNGLITGSGVHNGKDPFTPNGTRRTFKQTHYDVTPENIVKSMLSQGDEKGTAGPGFMGIDTLRAAASENLNSISDMHKAEARIQNLTEAELTLIKDTLNDRLMDAIGKITRNSGEEQGIGSFNNVGNIIEEAAKKKNFSEKVLRETFDEYPLWKVSDEDVKELADIVKEAAAMPTDMFEAKPQRVVRYDEIATALVPNDTDEDVIQALEDRGIGVTFYNAEQEGDRNEKLKNMDGIRFQLRLDDDDAFSGTMEEQNEKLKRANAYLTNMLQASKNLMPSSRDISKAADNMLKEYNSKFSKKQLTEQLSKLYTYIRTSENVDGAEVSSVAEAIAKQVVDNAVAADPEQEEMWKRLKKEMRQTSIYISPDDISDLSPEGYGALRKRWFGKINLTTKEEMRENTGSSEYRQLKESFPDVFTADPDSFFNEADAVQAIFDAYEKARPREESLFGSVASAQEAAADLSSQIMDAYFEVGSESVKNEYKKTYKQMREEIRQEVLNDYNDQLNKIVIRDQAKLSELKKAYAAQEIAPEIYLVQKDALNDYARQQREAADARFREKRDKNIEYGYRSTYKRNIMKDSRGLLKMIQSPSDKSHVPEAMVEPMLKILSHIDFSSNRVNYEGNPTQRSLKAQEFKNSVASLMDTVRQIEKNDGKLETETSTVQLTIDPDLMENLRRIQNLFTEKEELSDNIDNLSTQNMKEVWESLRALKKMVESANTFFATQNNTTVEEAATKTINELQGRKESTRWTGAAGALKKLMTTGMMDSYTYMHELGSSGAEMYQEARNGLDKKIRKIKRSVDFMSGLKEKHHLDDKTLREWSEKPIKVKLSYLSGDSIGASVKEKEVEMKPMQIMSLYLLNQRNQARQHLYGDKYSKNQQNGGFQLDEIKREGIKGALGMVTKDNTVYKVSEGTVERLTNMLTPEQKAVASAIGKFLTDETSAWGNEVTMQLYGYKKFQAKNYFPIKVADDTITKTSQQIEQGMTMLKNMGMTKSVQKKAYNPLVLEDIFDVFVRQTDEMSSYNAYVPVIADIQKWYNYKGESGNVQRSIERVMGKDGSTYMMNLLRDLNGGRDSDEWNVLYGMAGKYKGAAVGANLRTAIQQPTAYARAMAVMDPKYLLQGLTLNPRESARQYELCQEYAPIALWKEWGSYDINVGRSMNQILMGTSSKLDQVREASMWLAGKGDEVAWVRLWYSSQKQVEDQTDLKPGTKEFYEESAKVFNHVIDTTQVVDSVLHRSDMMKDKSVYAKSLTSFMAEPTKTYNMLYRAWASLSRGEEGAKKNAARIAAVYVITATLTTAAASVVSALRNNDKDKTYGEKYIESVRSDLLDNLLPWNNIPFIKDLISVASGDDTTDLNTEGLSNLFEAIEEVEKAAKGESKYGPLGLLYKASDAGSLAGLALRNGMKDMGGLIDTFVIGNNSEMEYWRNKLMYNMGAQNSSGEYSNAKYFLASAMRAYAQGDTEVGDRITGELKEIMGEDKINNMMKNQLQKEPEVEELGEAMLNGDTKKQEKLKKSLLDKGYSEEQIEAKAESALSKLAPISTGDLAEALYEKSDGYKDSLKEYTEYQKKLGKTDKDIQSKIRSALTSKYKQEYIDNPKRRSEISKKLYGITVNGKQLYTSKDLQGWLK